MKTNRALVIVAGIISSIIGCTKQPPTATTATVEPQPAPLSKPPEPKFDQAKQDELDWLAFTLNPPWKRYDVIEHKDINGEEHRFWISGEFDEAKLKRYADEYAVKYGSNLAAIEVRFYDKVNRSRITDLRSDHLIACCEKADDGDPVYSYLPDESNEGSLLFWRQTHFDALKLAEAIKNDRAELEKRIRDSDEKREQLREVDRAKLVAKHEELNENAEQITERLKKPNAEIHKIEESIKKAKKANDFTRVQNLQSKLETLLANRDFEKLAGVRDEITSYANAIIMHDRLTERILKSRADANAKAK